MPKKILLIGGGGFIGSYLANELINNGYLVFIYDAFLNYKFDPKDYDLRLKQRLSVLGEASIYKGDIRARNRLEEVFKKVSPEYVINLAALSITNSNVKGRLKDDIISINIGGMENICEIIKESNTVEKFIFISSSFVYGDFNYFPVDEKHSLSTSNLYGKTKIAGEDLTYNLLHSTAIDCSILRLSSVYGFGDTNNRISQIIVDNASRSEPIFIYGDIKSKLDFTYVRDVAEGIIRVLSSKVMSEDIAFNLTYGQGRSLAEFVGIVKSYFPNLKLKVRDSTRSYPKRGALSIDRASNIFGYMPRFSLELGLKDYIHRIPNYAI